MEFKVYEGKDAESLKQTALEELGKTDKEVIFKVEEKKGGLFKGTTYTVKAYTIEAIASHIKEYLNELLTKMNIEATYETKIREDQISIRMHSEQSGILIGKNGQTLKALQNVIRAHVYQEIGAYPYILLDVSDYQEKRTATLERLAKRIAREVLRTHQEVVMDNMNSYERRIVHNALTEFKGIDTTSEGVEPNRHIVVRYKED